MVGRVGALNETTPEEEEDGPSPLLYVCVGLGSVVLTETCVVVFLIFSRRVGPLPVPAQREDEPPVLETVYAVPLRRKCHTLI